MLVFTTVAQELWTTKKNVFRPVEEGNDGRERCTGLMQKLEPGSAASMDIMPEAKRLKMMMEEL